MKTNHWQTTCLRILIPILTLVFFACGLPAAQAQANIGGHVGFVIPWVTHTGDHTTNIADSFAIGFPIGITFKGKGHMNLDLETVPSVQGHPRDATLTVDPGLVWSLPHGIG
jgi:hypothetical protein